VNALMFPYIKEVMLYQNNWLQVMNLPNKLKHKED